MIPPYSTFDGLVFFLSPLASFLYFCGSNLVLLTCYKSKSTKRIELTGLSPWVLAPEAKLRASNSTFDLISKPYSRQIFKMPTHYNPGQEKTYTQPFITIIFSANLWACNVINYGGQLNYGIFLFEVWRRISRQLVWSNIFKEQGHCNAMVVQALRSPSPWYFAVPVSLLIWCWSIQRSKDIKTDHLDGQLTSTILAGMIRQFIAFTGSFYRMWYICM